jgi:hypothetical protein
MEVEFANPTDVHKPMSYTHVVSIKGPGRVLYISDKPQRIVNTKQLESVT